MMQIHCFSCGQKMEFPERVGLREECDRCRSDVHVCRNCDFYDPKVYQECRETQAERVQEKDRANRCDYFRPRSGPGGIADDRAAKLKAAAEALFKKPSS